jgi:hypothetical protein
VSRDGSGGRAREEKTATRRKGHGGCVYQTTKERKARMRNSRWILDVSKRKKKTKTHAYVKRTMIASFSSPAPRDTRKEALAVTIDPFRFLLLLKYSYEPFSN